HDERRAERIERRATLQRAVGGEAGDIPLAQPRRLADFLDDGRHAAVGPYGESVDVLWIGRPRAGLPGALAHGVELADPPVEGIGTVAAGDQEAVVGRRLVEPGAVEGATCVGRRQYRGGALHLAARVDPE